MLPSSTNFFLISPFVGVCLVGEKRVNLTLRVYFFKFMPERGLIRVGFRHSGAQGGIRIWREWEIKCDLYSLLWASVNIS